MSHLCLRDAFHEQRDAGEGFLCHVRMVDRTMLIKRNRGRHWLNWQRRMVVVAQAAGIGACLWLVVALVFGDMGILQYLAMRDHAGRLEGELAALQQETAALQKDITRLQHDPEKIEQVARERLGYVRKGETVYQLVPNHADSRQQPVEKP